VLSGPDELLESGPRLPRRVLYAGVGVLAAALLTAVLVKTTGAHRTARPAPSTSHRPLNLPPVEPADLAGLSVRDLAMDPGGVLYVLTNWPTQLVAIDRAGGISGQVVAPSTGRRVVANRTSDLVWVLAPHGTGTDVFTYAGSTMAALGQFYVPARVAAAAPFDNQLWMATNHGVYRGPRGTTAVRLPGYSGDVRQIAADPLRFRLLAVSQTYGLLTVDAHGVHPVAGPRGPLRPESIAVTGDSIWVVGHGQPFGTRLGRLDPHTLRVTAVGPPDPQAEDGATAWAGDGAVWIKYPVSGSIVCLDARTGQASGAFTDTDAPVTSVRGLAYAVRSNGVVRLPTTAGCPG
jgi:hypothetical protein